MFEIVINTFEAVGTPHIEALRKTNPGKNIHVNCGRNASEPFEKLSFWRNCDREIRNWWKKNRDKVVANHVVFIEGDVLVNYDLEDLVSPYVDLVGKDIRYYPNDLNWDWWIDRTKLPNRLLSSLTGIAPLAVLVFSRRALDEIVSEKWDEVYAGDIFCELRTPTIVKSAGLKIDTHVALEGLRWDVMKHPGNKPGIWHAVK